MKTIIVILLILTFSSCKNSKGDKNWGTVDLPQDQLQMISESICTDGQSLVLIESDQQPILSLTKAIAFISGNSACALEQSIDDEWYDALGARRYFKVEIQECVPNNSIWTFKLGSTPDNKVDYTYQNYEQTKQIKIKGTDDVTAAYARDHAGIRILECQ